MFKISILCYKNSRTWYHGSPLEIDFLKIGSSITKNKNLAMAFSYKPTQLSVDNNGNITHNGTKKGILYRITEEIGLNDIEKHSACSTEDPWEYITKRELKIEKIME